MSHALAPQASMNRVSPCREIGVALGNAGLALARSRHSLLAGLGVVLLAGTSAGSGVLLGVL